MKTGVPTTSWNNTRKMPDVFWAQVHLMSWESNYSDEENAWPCSLILIQENLDDSDCVSIKHLRVSLERICHLFENS